MCVSGASSRKLFEEVRSYLFRCFYCYPALPPHLLSAAHQGVSSTNSASFFFSFSLTIIHRSRSLLSSISYSMYPGSPKGVWVASLESNLVDQGRGLRPGITPCSSIGLILLVSGLQFKGLGHKASSALLVLGEGCSFVLGVVLEMIGSTLCLHSPCSVSRVHHVACGLGLRSPPAVHRTMKS